MGVSSSGATKLQGSVRTRVRGTRLASAISGPSANVSGADATSVAAPDPIVAAQRRSDLRRVAPWTTCRRSRPQAAPRHAARRRDRRGSRPPRGLPARSRRSRAPPTRTITSCAAGEAASARAVAPASNAALSPSVITSTARCRCAGEKKSACWIAAEGREVACDACGLPRRRLAGAQRPDRRVEDGAVHAGKGVRQDPVGERRDAHRDPRQLRRRPPGRGAWPARAVKALERRRQPPSSWTCPRTTKIPASVRRGTESVPAHDRLGDGDRDQERHARDQERPPAAGRAPSGEAGGATSARRAAARPRARRRRAAATTANATRAAAGVSNTSDADIRSRSPAGRRPRLAGPGPGRRATGSSPAACPSGQAPAEPARGRTSPRCSAGSSRAASVNAPTLCSPGGRHARRRGGERQDSEKDVCTCDLGRRARKRG